MMGSKNYKASGNNIYSPLIQKLRGERQQYIYSPLHSMRHEKNYANICIPLESVNSGILKALARTTSKANTELHLIRGRVKKLILD